MTLSWTGSACATSYMLQAGSSSGSSNLANSNVGNLTSYVATGVGAGTYYVRVVAQNASGQAPASNEVVLTVGSVSSSVDVQPRTVNFGRQGACAGATLSQAFAVSAPAGVTWTVSVSGSSGGRLDTTAGSGSGTVTFTITVAPQSRPVFGCNQPLGEFNRSDDITFRFSNGTTIVARDSWVYLVV